MSMVGDEWLSDGHKLSLSPGEASWIMSFFTGQPQYVRVEAVTRKLQRSSRNCSDTLPLHISHLRLQFPLWFLLLQKFSNGSSIVGCIKEDSEQEGTARGDCQRNRRPPVSLFIQENQEERADTDTLVSKSLANWTGHIVPSPGRDRAHFRQSLGSFSVCSRPLHVLYQPIITSTLVFAVVCGGGGIKAAEAKRLN